MTVYELYKNVISVGTYDYVESDMEERIETVYAAGKITAEERAELLTLAAENAKDAAQIDVAAKLAELESRIAVLEAKGVVVWTQGHVTAKGETVLYDVNKDGILEYCRYDGGRASTALSPGKINGWVILHAEGGQIVSTLEKDDEGKVIIVPVTSPEA
jgi:hypothetical protein